jgi:hypothetical protein
MAQIFFFKKSMEYFRLPYLQRKTNNRKDGQDVKSAHFPNKKNQKLYKIK